MFNPFKSKVAVISLSVGILLVGFQNCSKIKIDSEDVTGLNSGLNTDELPDGSSNEINQPPSAGSPPGNSGQPPAAEQLPMPPAVKPPMAPEDNDCVDFALNKKKSEDKEHEEAAGIACNKDKDEIKQKPKCFVKEDDDDDGEDYEGTCAKAKIKTSSRRIQSFEHVRGSYVLTKESLGSSSLDSINDFRGKLIICDVDVDKIENTRGKIVMVNSRIGSFINHRGKAVLRNSTVDECSDIKGKLDIEGGKAACFNVVSSLGRIDIKRSK